MANFCIYFKKNRSKYNESERRIVTFYAEDVHDFAWVTTPNFLYESGSWNGVDVHVLYNQKNGRKLREELYGQVLGEQGRRGPRCQGKVWGKSYTKAEWRASTW